ncbi:MAG TPA: TIGR02206 family membrane protein [Clostridiales bacterium]|nr:TIGR02206 family membrane protein [Clostridiales bacterium]
MWQYFWSYQTDLPAGSGVALYDPTHLAWLAGSLALIVLSVLVYRRLSKQAQWRLQLTLALLMTGGYFVRWTWFAILGHYDVVEMLPLQLCNLTAFLELAAILSGSTFLKEFGYACGLSGGLVSFLLPTMGPYPFWHFYYLQFLAAHLILILLPAIWIWGDGFRPDWRRLPRVFSLVLLIAAVDVLLNALIGSNYLYLNYVPGESSLKPIGEALGIPGYQFVMAGLLFLVWLIQYLPWGILERRKLQRAQAAQPAELTLSK